MADGCGRRSDLAGAAAARGLRGRRRAREAGRVGEACSLRTGSRAIREGGQGVHRRGLRPHRAPSDRPRPGRLHLLLGEGAGTLPACSVGMTTEHDREVGETEVIDPAVSERRVERVERVREPGYAAPAGQVNVSTSPYAPVWTVTRVITLLFTVLEVLLLIRFAMKLLGANPQQPL